MVNFVLDFVFLSIKRADNTEFDTNLTFQVVHKFASEFSAIYQEVFIKCDFFYIIVMLIRYEKRFNCNFKNTLAPLCIR